ncbi:sodium-coupled monocarboxylate transporter 1-like isoform X2 [Physella acuta]|uniref:sodium-coupled monocarboxylate transporter 1-like isoform X2 n=1 Tax=Physella acuta TaxID=109671 RepID=UPI0027DE42CE|nr:sodium-coupled monocarboxylate transporter 1-like isoform X2 [Physella acuta]
MVVVKNAFGPVDYVVFAAMLIISMAIGVWFALRGGKQRTQGEYLMGNRKMAIVPVAISMLVSFFSAILVLGTPAEMYTQGTEYYLTTLGMMFGVVLAALTFVPLLFPLKLTSAFEYLEKRFQSRSTRLVGTLLSVLTQIIYMGLASFAPSTALEAVTGFPVWGTILSTGAVATLYTTIGGMKAVIWTDVFQSIIMIAGILAIVIQGTLKVGGMSRVWEINEEWGRIKFFNFDPNPMTRHTVWNLVIGTALAWMGTFGVNQASVQRYNSLATLRRAKMSVLLNILGVFIMLTLTCLSGIVVFAYYANQKCNPLGQKLIRNSNQLVPYFVMETLGYPGVPGLFISCLFSGALSSVSSSLNALGAITWEDVLKPRYDHRLTEYQKTLVTKITVVIYGCLAVGVSFLAQQLEGTVLQAASALIGSVAGPLCGMFVLGALFPWANSYGAISGALVAVALSLWLSIGSYVYGIRLPPKSFPNGTCAAYFNVSTKTLVTRMTPATTLTSTMSLVSTAHYTPVAEREGVDIFYGISYMWFSTIGLLCVIVVGLIVSFITGANSTNDVPTKYQIPVFTRLCCCLPNSWLHFLNCYRHFQRPQDMVSEEKEIIITAPPIKERVTNVGFLSDDQRMAHDVKHVSAVGVDPELMQMAAVYHPRSDNNHGISNGTYVNTERISTHPIDKEGIKTHVVLVKI